MKRILTSLFSRSPADLLKKGDDYLASERFFDARTSYEDGLQRCKNDVSDQQMKSVLEERIVNANHSLAELNFREAEFARNRGDFKKAVDHLELVKTLTNDKNIRYMADKMLVECSQSEPDEIIEPSAAPRPSSSCSSCSSSTVGEHTNAGPEDQSMEPLEYYELLIQQLPGDLCQRYTNLGADFANAYIAASQNRHTEALSLLERCSAYVDRDIYVCEKGRILHRLENEDEAERCFRTSIELNSRNPLAWLSLALLLMEDSRVEDAMKVVDRMVAEHMMPEQASLMRAELLEAIGSTDDAIEQYRLLLTTPLARAAAEKLYGLLMQVDRQQDAAFVLKKYLGSCCH